MLNGGVFRSFWMKSEGLGCPASTGGLPAFWYLHRGSHRLSPITALEDDGYKPTSRWVLQGPEQEAGDSRWICISCGSCQWVTHSSVMTYGSTEGHGFGLPRPRELERGCQMFPGKGQRVNILSFAGHMVSVIAVYLYGASTKRPQTSVSL